MNFHYIVRGVVLQEDQILLVREINSPLSFLPGGHVEPGEPAQKALKRELLEEMGLSAEIGSFLGAVENSWYEKDIQQFEINLLFEATIPYTSQIKAKEPHLEFLWAERSALHRHNLLPAPLVEYLSHEYNIRPRPVFWGTTLG